MAEDEVLKRFKQSSHLLLEKTPESSFDWLFWMQHYGVPTRLLDWTESPLTALYFVVEDTAHHGFDGALWVLDPIRLNRAAGIQDETGSFLPSFDHDYLKNYNPEVMAKEAVTKLNPVGAIATRNNPRIQAQLGVFTVYHRKNAAIDSVDDGKHAVKLVIPSDSKSNLLNELNVLGINRFTVFPEIASIGHNLKRAMGL